MAHASVDITIAREVSAVWPVVADFGALDTWMPGIESCTLAGDVRTLALMGMEIRERLLSRDDTAHELSYGIVDGSALGVESHRATITVERAPGGSLVTWAVDATPDAMAEVMKGLYAQSLEALKGHCEA